VNYRRRILTASIPVAMYLTSLIVPATGSFVKGSSTTYSGADAFRVGWRAMFMDGWNEPRIYEWLELVAAWWANPAIWAASFSFVFGWRKLTIAFAAGGAVLAMTVLPNWWQAFIEYPSYWLWWGSALVTLAMALFLLPRRATPFAEDYGPLAAPAETPFAEPLTPVTP
jgi:hypothetical protein